MVYFILNKQIAAIKIGKANDCKKRFEALQGAYPMPLVLIGYIEGGFEVEHKFHQHFSAYKIRGEWFKADEEVMRQVVEILKVSTWQKQGEVWDPNEMLVFSELISLLVKHGWLAFSLKGPIGNEVDELIKEKARRLTHEGMDRVFDAVWEYAEQAFGEYPGSCAMNALDHRFDSINGWWA